MADHIEQDAKEKGEDVCISVYHELPIQMKVKGANFIRYLILFACLLMTGSSNIANLSAVSVELSTNLDFNLYLTKLLVTAFFCSIMIFIVEPERIKTILIIVTATLIAMVGMVMGYSGKIIHENQQIPNNNLVQYTMFNFANMGVFLGVSSYAFESIGSIFNVRRVMQQRSAMPRLQIGAFIFIAATYYVTGLLVYLAYGNNNVKDLVFKYYSMETSPVMNSLGYIFCATCIFNIPFNIIALIENLEALPALRKFFMTNGDISRVKVTLARIFAIVLSMAVTLITDNIARILSLTGSLAAPLISYIIPLALYWQFKKPSKFMYIHDGIVMALGLVIGGFGIYSTIYFE